MNIAEIENNLQDLIKTYDEETFINPPTKQSNNYA